MAVTHRFTDRSRFRVRVPRAVAVAIAVLAIIAASTATAGAAGGAPGASVSAGNPLSALPFFVQKDTDASEAVRGYRAAGDVTDANLMARIADQPQAIWLAGGPESIAELTSTLRQAKRQHELPTYVLYDIPGRNCGSYSSGGATSASDYETWISQIAQHLGSTPVAVIIEPDALAGLSCWSSSEQAQNLSLIRFAATTLQAKGNTAVYLDAGNNSWNSVHTMVVRLRHAGVGRVRGFALNVANFQTTASSLAYGKRISRALGGKHFVIDTSRNGRGPPSNTSGDWTCNPPGRGLGADPTTETASPLVDAYLWVKIPGASDGPCNGGPQAGGWWPAYALSLAQNAEGTAQSASQPTKSSSRSSAST